MGIAGLLLILAAGACSGDGDLNETTGGTESPIATRPVEVSVPAVEAEVSVLAVEAEVSVPAVEVEVSVPAVAAEGPPVTVERLEGIWFEDRGTGVSPAPVLARFASDGSFALGGVLERDSWLNGTYIVEGQRIMFTATGGACGSRDTFAWDVTIVADGRLEGRHAGAEGDQPALVGECFIPVGEPYNFSQISPISPAAAEISAGRFTRLDVGPLSSEIFPSHLDGYWLVEGTGHLLRWGPSGSYRLDDAGEMATNPRDVGTVELGPSTLTFTSGADSHGCALGDVMVWENVEIDDEGLRGVVRTDACGRALGDEMTLRFLGVDTP